MNTFTRYGALLLFASSLALTACGEPADDHSHSHDGEAAHQHDDEHGHAHENGDPAHDTKPSVPETEAFYAEDASLESSSTEQAEKTHNHQHDGHEHAH